MKVMTESANWATSCVHRKPLIGKPRAQDIGDNDAEFAEQGRRQHRARQPVQRGRGRSMRGRSRRLRRMPGEATAGSGTALLRPCALRPPCGEFFTLSAPA